MKHRNWVSREQRGEGDDLYLSFSFGEWEGKGGRWQEKMGDPWSQQHFVQVL